MIEKFDTFRYKFKEQRKLYLEISKNLTESQKEQLAKEILEKNLWAYFQVITEVLFDLASDDTSYLKLLKDIYNKVKFDLASSPFFEMLIRIGKEKKELGIRIYDLIQEKEGDSGFKVISGLILGGYSIQDDSLLKRLVKKQINYPLTSTLLRAILVRYENEKKIDKEIYSYFKKIENSDNEIILRELMNVYLALYKINPAYFYDQIKKLMSQEKSRVNGMVFIRSKKLGLSSKQFFELAKLTKNCDEYALSEFMYAVIDYPKEVEKISELFIYWINKNLEFKIRNFDWALQELTKKNKSFIRYFLQNYKKIGTEKLPYIHLFPRIFEKLASQNVEEAMRQLMTKKIHEKNSRLFYKLVSKVVGLIYDPKKTQKNMFDLFLPLAKKIEEIAENTDFVNDNKKSFEELTRKKNFDGLINYIYELLSQLRSRKENYDFKEIKDSLKEFKQINDITKDKIQQLKNKKRYSPLFWLGEKHRNQELKKVYLEELNKGVKEDKSRAKHLSNSLGNEGQFWERASEIFFTNKFLDKKSKYHPELEVQILNRDSKVDLKIELNNKEFYFEIKKLGINRNLALDNGAVGIKNKARYILEKIHSQHFSEDLLKQIKAKKDKTMIFAVLDISSSTVDDYEILDALYGSSGFEWFRNEKTNETTEPKFIRKKDSLGDKNENTNILSGVIYFKTRLELENNEPKLKLKGDIIINPNAINKPTRKEVEELKEIIFEG